MSDTEKLQYLINTLKSINNSIDNQSPDLALWEIRRIISTIESWENT